MAIKVKAVAEAASKLVQRAQAASAEYGTEAQAAAEVWASNTQASGQSFQQGISAGNIMQRFLGGVRKAGAAKFARKVREVGANRFSQGVAAGQQDYVQNVEPYFSTIAGLSLSARQPRGSAANYQRVSQVGDALHSRRIALLGGGGS